MRALENSIHRLLAKSGLAAKIAAKMRNQANCVIAYHLGETADSNFNGEFALINHVGHQIKTFIDVGANIGDWSNYMFKQSNSKGYMFEPSSICAQRLVNRFKNCNAIIRNIALSDYNGVAEFVEEDNYGEGSSLAETHVPDGSQRKEVKIATLDTELPNNDSQIDYLKIDTEGYDLKVMKGGRKLLSRTRFLQFEYNYHWISVGSSLIEAERYLKTFGFCLFLVRSTGLHPLRYSFWGDYFRYSNFFACRPTDFDFVKPLFRDPF